MYNLTFQRKGEKLFKIILALTFLFTLANANEPYKLGEGVKLSSSLPIYIGGYISLEYRETEHQYTYNVDDIALMSYANINRFSYMVELEYKEFYQKKYINNIADESTNSKLYTERLYVDYNYNENYLLRLGKYNSPIGFWNLLPINVLRSTTSSPMTNELIYPTFTTGVLLSYLYFSQDEIQVDVILQHNDSIDTSYNNYKIDKHYGLGATYTRNNFSTKVNFGSFHQKQEDQTLYYLLSTKYETNNFEIMGAFGEQYSSNLNLNNKASYIQYLYHINQKHHAILRVESYKDSSNDEAFVVVAYTYRPLYPIALKSEYQIHKDDDINQFLISLSVLF